MKKAEQMTDEGFRFDVKFQYGTGNFIFSLYASSGLVEAVAVFCFGWGFYFSPSGIRSW